MARRLYLDWNATAPLLPEARAALIDALAFPSNPSSVHDEGRQARRVVEGSRQQIADLTGVPRSHVVFTASASEAANFVLTPDFRMGRTPMRLGKLLVSAVEHPCVLAGGRFDAGQVVQLPVDSQGLLDCDALERELREIGASETIMVAVQLANNETGVVQPIAKIASIVKRHGGVLVVDAVQAAGRLPIACETSGADFLILSGHKIGGVTGAGALVASGETLMPAPLVRGGGQERGHRAGTEAVAAIAAFGAAARTVGPGVETFQAQVGALRDRMEQAMRQCVPALIIHGEGAPRLANTSCVSVPGMKAETLQIALDLDGIAVSAGSACSSGRLGPSHVLLAMGADAALGAIRISLGASTSEADIDRFVASFARITANRSAHSVSAQAEKGHFIAA